MTVPSAASVKLSTTLALTPRRPIILQAETRFYYTDFTTCQNKLKLSAFILGIQ